MLHPAKDFVSSGEYTAPGGILIRKATVASVIATLFVLSGCMLPGNGSAEPTGIQIGDWWEYAVSEPTSSVFHDVNMTATGSIRMNVTSLSTVQSQGVSYAVYVMTVTGLAAGSGSAPNVTSSMTLTYTGSITRLASDFSLLKSDIKIAVAEIFTHDWQYFGGKSTYFYNTSVTLTTQFAPAINDYVGDTDIETFTQTENMSSYQTVKIIQEGPPVPPDVEEYNGTYAIRIRMFQPGAQLTVPAGTFECTKLQVNETIDGAYGHSKESYWYYSKAVGNYISGTGGFGPMPWKTDLKLRAYSYDPPVKTTDLLSSPILYISIAIVGAAVALLLVVRHAKKKRYARRGY